MVISTIVLNWNRAALLAETLRSYITTVEPPFELFVIDNGSTDLSRDVIESTRALVPGVKTIFLQENVGGKAINLALDEAKGDLIHISENDQIFLPGWAGHAREAFRVFPDLGQLSLCGVTPTDEEAWELKPSRLRFAGGKILYEAEANVGTSSVLRSNLIHARNIRVHNIPSTASGQFLFPDDGRLSKEIKEAGFWCAWSEKYYVRNVGHELNEFDRDPEYYARNYASKPWLGVAGWQARVERNRLRPKFLRRSTVFPSADLQAEKTPGEVHGKSAQLWSMFDGFTAESEVLDFLYTLTRLVKPQHAIETGTWLGRSSIAIASALKDNGFGHLVSIEVDPEVAAIATKEIRQAGVDVWVDVFTGNSLEFTPTQTFEFAFFDSDVSMRAAEFKRFYDHLAPMQ